MHIRWAYCVCHSAVTCVEIALYPAIQSKSYQLRLAGRDYIQFRCSGSWSMLTRLLDSTGHDLIIKSALIAQLVERVTSNDEVAGSTPS